MVIDHIEMGNKEYHHVENITVNIVVVIIIFKAFFRVILYVK